MHCKCGCGDQAKPGGKFVNKEHQLDWMRDGGAREIGALEPPEARRRGGVTAGRARADDGSLAEAGLLGAERAKEIAQAWRDRQGSG